MKKKMNLKASFQTVLNENRSNTMQRKDLIWETYAKANGYTISQFGPKAEFTTAKKMNLREDVYDDIDSGGKVSSYIQYAYETYEIERVSRGRYHI